MDFKAKDLLLLGAIAGGIYLVYQLIQGAKSVGGAVVNAASTAYTATTTAIGSGLFTLFGPDDVGTSYYYTTTFPDGSRHAVPSNTVNSSGVFSWTGYPAGSQPAITLQLVKDANNNWFATDPGSNP